MSWLKASEGDQALRKAISFLFHHRKDKLLHFVINPDHPRLAAPSDIIKAEAMGLSSSEQLLVRIALDAWDGSGGIHFNELYEVLDDQTLQRVILVLNFLYAPGKSHNL